MDSSASAKWTNRMGYLEKDKQKGLANGFQTLEQPSDGEVELSELNEPLDFEKRRAIGEFYSWTTIC